MAYDIVKNVKIRGIACAVPKDVLKIEDFYQYVGRKNAEEFAAQSGVREKRCSKDFSVLTSDLCVAASEKLLQVQDIDRSTIDAVILVTQSPDFQKPTTACTIQHRLGLSENTIAYDVSLGCSGYVYGLHIASKSINGNYIKRVLLLAGDTTEGNYACDNLNHLLLGDCGSATLLEYDENAKDMKFELRTMGSGCKALMATEGLRYKNKEDIPHIVNGYMDGLAVFAFATAKVPRLILSFFNEFKIEKEKIDYFFLHQANMSILKGIMKKIKVSIDKMPVCLEKYANTSSASIPNTICHHFENINEDNKEVRAVLSGFGIGLSLGVCEVYLKPDICLPIIETDLTWEDGYLKLEDIKR